MIASRLGERFLLGFLFVGLLLFPFATFAQERGERPEREQFRESRDVRVAESRARDDEIIVKFADDELFSRVRVPEEASAADVLSEFRRREDVVYAEPNYIAYALAVPNDPFYAFQWHLDNVTGSGVNFEKAYGLSQGGGVVVAIIDTGVAYEDYRSRGRNRTRYYQAPDLASTAFVPGYDFVENDTHPNDDNGHGTHVAGTVSQSTNNNLGVAGLAGGARIMPIKVLNAHGSGSYADVAEGIRFAADNGAQVINLSLGGSSGATYLEEALAYAYNRGVTIVAAAGNNGSSSLSYPAAYDAYVVAVGATRYDSSRASYSNYGSSLDIVAPGGDTSVDQNGDGYGDGVLQQTFGNDLDDWGYYFFQGTSMAAPHVAGAAALVIANGTATAPPDVRAVLESTARDLGAPGRDNQYGHGLLDAHAALIYTAPAVEPTPEPPPPPPEPEPLLPEPEPEPPAPEPEPEPPSEPEPEPPPPEPEPPSAPAVLFEDSFENDLDWWSQDVQRDWKNSSREEFDGRRAAEVDGRAQDAALMSPIIDLSGFGTAVISFAWFIERSLDSGEYLAFDISTDEGSTWSEYARLRGEEDPEDTWFVREFALSGAASVMLRFRGTMDRSSEDAYVDLVRVAGE